MSNGAFDRVQWVPQITYTNRTNQSNPNGQGTAVYKAEEGYVYNEDGILRLSSPANAQVKGIFEKPVTSDNITLKALLSTDEKDNSGNPNPAYIQTIVYTREFAWDETHTGELSFTVNNTINGVNLKFEIISETNVALEKIKWNPVVEYTNGTVSYRNRATVSYTSFANHVTEGQPYNLLTGDTLKIEPKFSGLPVLPDPSINGKLLMAVKNVTGLLAKQEVTITGGLVAPSSVISQLPANAGAIWVEYYVTDQNLLSRLGNPTALITVKAVASTVTVNTFTTRNPDGFNITNRGWGQFVYNANDGRYGTR